MSKRDKARYDKLKADPARYAVYLERKRRERKARKEYQTLRKRTWRAANPENSLRIRQASHAVEYALKTGQMVRPAECSECAASGKIEAHHHKGYAREHWLDVQWLCVFCHRKADGL